MSAKKKKSTSSKRGMKASAEFFKILGVLCISIFVGIIITNLVLKEKKDKTPSVVPVVAKKSTVTYKPTEVKRAEVVKPAPVAPKQTNIRKEVLPPPKKIEVHQPAIVFVIDDIGNSNEYESELIALGNHVTYAILPQLPYTRHFAELGRRNGAEIIVHLPMEADDGRFPGPGVLLTKMSRSTAQKIIERDLDSVPYHVGVNNHMGSRGTSDSRLMKTLLNELKRRNLFFLDSFTTHDSVAVEVGGKVGIAVLRRDVFLDNVDDKQAIKIQIRELKEKAKENGVAIGIGHIRKNTLEVLHEEISAMRKEGFAITTLRGLLER